MKNREFARPATSKRFVLKVRSEHKCYLYIDDPRSSGFSEIDNGKAGMVLKNDTIVALYKEDPFKTIWFIMNNEPFSVTVRKEAELAIIDDHLLYEDTNQWYAMMPHGDGCKAILLGKRFEATHGYPDNMTYNCLKSTYFLRKYNDDKTELVRFVDGELVISDPYLEFAACGAKILARREASLIYDIFVPNKSEPINGETTKAFEDFHNVYIWSKQNNDWLCHSESRLLGKNAVYRIVGEGKDEKLELYRITPEGGLEMVASGSWHWNHTNPGVCVDGMLYLFNEEKEMLDLDNPKPTFKRKIRDFFKLG